MLLENTKETLQNTIKPSSNKKQSPKEGSSGIFSDFFSILSDKKDIAKKDIKKIEQKFDLKNDLKAATKGDLGENLKLLTKDFKQAEIQTLNVNQKEQKSANSGLFGDFKNDFKNNFKNNLENLQNNNFKSEVKPEFKADLEDKIKNQNSKNSAEFVEKSAPKLTQNAPQNTAQKAQIADFTKDLEEQKIKSTKENTQNIQSAKSIESNGVKTNSIESKNIESENIESKNIESNAAKTSQKAQKDGDLIESVNSDSIKFAKNSAETKEQNALKNPIKSANEISQNSEQKPNEADFMDLKNMPQNKEILKSLDEKYNIKADFKSINIWSENATNAEISELKANPKEMAILENLLKDTKTLAQKPSLKTSKSEIKSTIKIDDFSTFAKSSKELQKEAETKSTKDLKNLANSLNLNASKVSLEKEKAQPNNTELKADLEPKLNSKSQVEENILVSKNTIESKINTNSNFIADLKDKKLDKNAKDGIKETPKEKQKENIESAPKNIASQKAEAINQKEPQKENIKAEIKTNLQEDLQNKNNIKNDIESAQNNAQNTMQKEQNLFNNAQILQNVKSNSQSTKTEETKTSKKEEKLDKTSDKFAAKYEKSEQIKAQNANDLLKGDLAKNLEQKLENAFQDSIQSENNLNAEQKKNSEFLDNLLKGANSQNKSNLNSAEKTEKNVDLKSELNAINSSNLSQNRIKISETFTHFSDKLRDALNAYKAPLTQLKMVLNPENLGEVELSISKRGEKFDLKISGSQNAIELFLQNAEALKAHLNEQGFSDVSIEFKGANGENISNDLSGGFNNNNEQNNNSQSNQNTNQNNQNFAANQSNIDTNSMPDEQEIQKQAQILQAQSAENAALHAYTSGAFAPITMELHLNMLV